MAADLLTVDPKLLADQRFVYGELARQNGRGQLARYRNWEVPQHYATGPGLPGPTNSYIPNLESSGRLIVGYSRNPKKFNLPKYVEYIESDHMVGYYMKLSPQEAARVVTTQEFEWPDGQARPMHEDGLEFFNMVPFRTHRYDYGAPVGWMTNDQAEWPVVEQMTQIHAAQGMTARTVRMLAVATTTANWTVAGGTDPDLSSDHTATATSFAGGQLDLGTSTAPFIKKFLDKAAVLICLDTLTVISQDKLHWIINPNQARLWAESSEIHEYIKGSYWAKEEINKGLSPNNRFGLPSELYGYDGIVEDTVRVTTRKRDTLAKSFAMPDQQVLIAARPGELEGVYGGRSFSTLSLFWYKDELTVETFSNERDRLTEVHVTENCSEILSSPLSGFLLTSSTSVSS